MWRDRGGSGGLRGNPPDNPSEERGGGSRCSLVLREHLVLYQKQMSFTQRSTAWSVTINNPNTKYPDDENIALARQKHWKVHGQLEVGKEKGTPHYQLMLETPQVRMSAVIKQFPGAHVEACRNRAALMTYVNKEETRTGVLPTSQEQYPSQQRIWEWFEQQRSIDQLRQEFQDTPGTTDRFEDWVVNTEQMLKQFDAMIAQKIMEGYYCELIGVNPQVRSAVKKYGLAILEREYIRRQTRQTDRQEVSSEIFVPQLVITDADEEERTEEGSV